MDSNSKALVECPQKVPLLGIRAPLTLSDSDSDSEACFEVYDSAPPLVQPSSPSLRVTPFAHVSTYDDDSQQESEDEMEHYDHMSSVVRVPDNFVAAPRIKVLDVQQQIVENFMFMNSLPVSPSLLANEFTFFSDTEDDIGIANALVVDDHGLDQVLYDDDSVAYDEYSIATDTDVMSQYSQDHLNDDQFAKPRVVVLNGLEKETLIPQFIETDSTMQRKLHFETGEANDMVEGTSITDADTSLLKSSVEDHNDSRMQKQNTSSVIDLQEQNSELGNDFSVTGEPVSDAFAENIECSTTQRTAADESEGFAFDQQSECEKLVGVTKSMTNFKAALHDSSASFESHDDAYEGNRIHSVESVELFHPTLLQDNTYLENDLSKTVLGVTREDELSSEYLSCENVEIGLNLGDTVKKEASVDLNTVCQESKRDGCSASDGDAEGLMSVGLEQFKEQISALSILLGSKGPGKNCQEEQTVRSSHGKVNLPMDVAERKLNCVASGGDLGESDGSTVTVTYADESSAIFLKDQTCFSSLPHCAAQAGFKHNISEKENEKIQKIQDMSVKFLRLVQRVNLSIEDSLVSKVLCKLVADIGRRVNQEFVIESAKISARKLEENCLDDLDFSLNIIVLGKSGVGKSATINSIFGEMKVVTNAFEPATTSVKEVSGTMDGVKIRILDTPGLRSPMKEQAFNRKILSSIKRYVKKYPPDMTLYVDRVDAPTRDLNDLPILRSITSSLSPSIWQRAILTLTHAASTPLDGPTGSPLSYEVFVAQKSYLVQQSITQAVGGLCELSPSFLCPVSLVENHPLRGKNISGECVLPNGLRWRSQLLALCFSLKILSEVSSVAGPQNLLDHWKHFFFQNHSAPLSHLFSSLLQSPAHLKFSANWN